MSTFDLDLDIHGIVGVRLVNAGPDDAASVQRLLGVRSRGLRREPDIVIRFVDRLPTPDLRYVEVSRSGFTDDGFLVLWHKKRPVRVKIPFDQLGSRCEMVCERGVPSIPFLLSAVKLTALGKGYVPFHGSAFTYAGSGVLVGGWTHGGKTSALLAFAQHGASFVADDLVLLRGDGRHMVGLATPVSISEAQLAQLPTVRRKVATSQRLFFRAVRGLERIGGLGRSSGVERGPARYIREILPALQRRCKVHLSPAELFGTEHVSSVTPRVLFLTMSHAAPDVRVEPIDSVEASARIVASLRYEDLDLLGHYLAFQYAFPRRENKLLEQARETETALLCRALSGMPTYLVRHPYPAQLPELYAKMRPFVECAGVPAMAPATAQRC